MSKETKEDLSHIQGFREMTWLQAWFIALTERQDGSSTFSRFTVGIISRTPGGPLAHEKWLGNSRGFFVSTKSKEPITAPRDLIESCPEPSSLLPLWVRATRQWASTARMLLASPQCVQPYVQPLVASEATFFMHPGAWTGWLLTLTVICYSFFFWFWVPYSMLCMFLSH